MQNNKTITSFGIEQSYLINLYSDENPILKEGDKCYFIFSNLMDANILFIGYGEITHDKFIDGMDKNYYIKLLKMHSPAEIQKKYIFSPGKTFSIVTGIGRSKIIRFNTNNLIGQTFSAHCFFVRPTYDAIRQLQKDYIKIIRTDLREQLIDIEKL